jgi:hypothetical protein
MLTELHLEIQNSEVFAKAAGYPATQRVVSYGKCRLLSGTQYEANIGSADFDMGQR